MTFLCRLTRQQAHEQIVDAAAVLFTGLREEGGASVIVLAHGGAKTIAEAAIDLERVAMIQPASIEMTTRQMALAMTRFSRNPSTNFDPNLDHKAARQVLKTVFNKLLASPKSFVTTKKLRN